jgi:hypothetical protein
MSWSIAIPPTYGTEIVKVIEALTLPSYASSGPFAAPAWETAMEEQLDAAKRGALAMLRTGSVGAMDTGVFAGTLSGHANPEHQPTEGWANDCVSVYLYQVTDPASLKQAKEARDGVGVA